MQGLCDVAEEMDEEFEGFGVGGGRQGGVLDAGCVV